MFASCPSLVIGRMRKLFTPRSIKMSSKISVAESSFAYIEQTLNTELRAANQEFISMPSEQTRLYLELAMDYWQQLKTNTKIIHTLSESCQSTMSFKQAVDELIH